MRLFLDANIFLDIYDNSRSSHKYSLKLYEYVSKNRYKLFTSCDLITTIYYINSKIDRCKALLNIQNINKTLKVIDFSNKEITQTCNLMIEDDDYKDLEDTIQYIMAKKEKCDIIISNNKNFISKDIKLMSSEDFCIKYVDEIKNQ